MKKLLLAVLFFGVIALVSAADYLPISHTFTCPYWDTHGQNYPHTFTVSSLSDMSQVDNLYYKIFICPTNGPAWQWRVGYVYFCSSCGWTLWQVNVDAGAPGTGSEMSHRPSHTCQPTSECPNMTSCVPYICPHCGDTFCNSSETSGLHLGSPHYGCTHTCSKCGQTYGACSSYDRGQAEPSGCAPGCTHTCGEDPPPDEPDPGKCECDHSGVISAIESLESTTKGLLNTTNSRLSTINGSIVSLGSNIDQVKAAIDLASSQIQSKQQLMISQLEVMGIQLQTISDYTGSLVDESVYQSGVLDSIDEAVRSIADKLDAWDSVQGGISAPVLKDKSPTGKTLVPPEIGKDSGQCLKSINPRWIVDPLSQYSGQSAPVLVIPTSLIGFDFDDCRIDFSDEPYSTLAGYMRSFFLIIVVFLGIWFFVRIVRSLEF